MTRPWPYRPAQYVVDAAPTQRRFRFCFSTNYHQKAKVCIEIIQSKVKKIHTHSRVSSPRRWKETKRKKLSVPREEEKCCVAGKTFTLSCRTIGFGLFGFDLAHKEWPGVLDDAKWGKRNLADDFHGRCYLVVVLVCFLSFACLNSARQWRQLFPSWKVYRCGAWWVAMPISKKRSMIYEGVEIIFNT